MFPIPGTTLFRSQPNYGILYHPAALYTVAPYGTPELGTPFSVSTAASWTVFRVGRGGGGGGLPSFRWYRGTSLIRNIPLLGTYSRTKPRVLL